MRTEPSADLDARSYKGITDTRLAEYPEVSAMRLLQIVRAAGYPGGNGYVKR